MRSAGESNTEVGCESSSEVVSLRIITVSALAHLAGPEEGRNAGGQALEAPEYAGEPSRASYPAAHGSLLPEKTRTSVACGCLRMVALTRGPAK